MALFSCCNLFKTCSMILCLVFLPWCTASSAMLMSSNHHHNYHKRAMVQTNLSSCALFSGTWVRDDSYNIYTYSECPIIEPEFNCQMYGRPDSDYLKYRWQPLNCDLPRFDGHGFLMGMRGKTVMFVGDSLGRNQWESLICMVLASAPQSPTQMARGDPLSTFTFSDFEVTLSYYRAPYLVDIDEMQGKRVLRLEDISKSGKAWQDADVLSFNTGHWWTHRGSLQGWDFMETGGKFLQDMDHVVAMEIGLRTWADWVNNNIDMATTKVFFLSISPTHYNPSEWTTSTMATTKNCYGETAPVNGTTYPGAGTYPEEMRVVDRVLSGMQNPPYLLDITKLSELRKDGHPSVYSGEITPRQRIDPQRSADCSHWCLPGLPDTWNQLFSTLLFS